MRSYRPLVAWQLAHELALLTLRGLDLPYHRRTQPLFDQLRRTVISIEANIVEGYALGTPALFGRHVRIALGSAAECECLYRLGSELGYFPDGLFPSADPLVDRCIATLRGLLEKSALRTSVPRTAHRSPRT